MRFVTGHESEKLGPKPGLLGFLGAIYTKKIAKMPRIRPPIDPTTPSDLTKPYTKAKKGENDNKLQKATHTVYLMLLLKQER